MTDECAHCYDAELINPHKEYDTPNYVVLTMNLKEASEAVFLFTCRKCGHTYTGGF